MDVGGRPRVRRKEVALGRLQKVSLILILGVLGGAAAIAAPDDPSASPSKATRQPPPAPPIKYLEAGDTAVQLSETSTQLDLASKYLAAADTYRDQLQPGEQAKLDAYLRELAKARASVRAKAAAAAAPAAGESPTASDQPQTTRTEAIPGRTADANRATTSAAASSDTKQQGRWLLHEAHEQLKLGNYDAAQRKVNEAEALDIKWGLFDDTPAKATEEIRKARPKSLGTPTTSKPMIVAPPR